MAALISTLAKLFVCASISALNLIASLAVSPALAADPTGRVIPPFDISRYPTVRPFRHRPPLPINVVPYDAIEPNRDVPAHDWLSPYCRRWNDGVETCSRDEGRIDRPATCAPFTADQQAPKRFTVVCEEMDWDAFDRVCARTGTAEMGPNVSSSSFSAANYFVFCKSPPRWVYGDGSGQTTVGQQTPPRPLAEAVRALTAQFGVREIRHEEIRGKRVVICLQPNRFSDKPWTRELKDNLGRSVCNR